MDAGAGARVFSSAASLSASLLCVESASGGQRSQQLKSRCIQRLALRVVPTRLAANDMLTIRGTLHLPACGVSNASSPFSWFTPGPRMRNLRPLWKSIHTTHREDTPSTTR